jgi:hypothetical protein
MPTRRAESSLATISHQMSMLQTGNQALAFEFSERLRSLEQAMKFRHSHPNSLLLTEQSGSSLPQFQLMSRMTPNLLSSVESVSPSVESSNLYNVNPVSLTNNIPLERCSQEFTQSTNRNFARSPVTYGGPPPSPASPLELSSSFWPEAYTCSDGVLKLFNYMTYQEDANDFTRVNHYAMFYAKSPRHWVRLTASVTFDVSSLLWDCERVATSSRSAYKLPRGLDTFLEGFLKSHPNVEQDANLKIYLGGRMDAKKIDGTLKNRVCIAEPAFQATAYLKEETNRFYHSKCPWWLEKDLHQIPLKRRIGQYFISYFQSRWVLDFRFGSSKEQIDSVLYHLKVLQCLQGASRICPFIGIIPDQETGVINSFLVEMPAKGPLTGMMESGTPISMERRERWCKEITQAVAQVHSSGHGFVVGNLGGYFANGVAIDEEDSAVLFRFEKSFKYGTINSTAVLPPECRPPKATEGKINATPQTDIYQLGLLIWRIASQTRPWKFCEFSGCTTHENKICIEPHTDPIQLPQLGQQVPQYLKHIIAACRTENPDHRPAAWALLEMFPQEAETSSAIDHGPLDENWDQLRLKRASQQLIRPLEEAQELYGQLTACDLCGRLARRHYFHCSICACANFDICPLCFSQGGHCRKPDHYLREFRDWNQINVYTNMKENGRREIVVL